MYTDFDFYEGCVAPGPASSFYRGMRRGLLRINKYSKVPGFKGTTGNLTCPTGQSVVQDAARVDTWGSVNKLVPRNSTITEDPSTRTKRHMHVVLDQCHLCL